MFIIRALRLLKNNRVVNWDYDSLTFEQNTYYHCRTDPDDLLENAEWFALNSYRHCDGFATSADEIIGWPSLQAAFKEANFPGPVLFGEYGCRERGFPTMDGFEAQRTWFQAEALYTPKYSDVFAGGFVFEYSAETEVIDTNLQFMADRINNGVPESEWPYKNFAKVNYGVGYFSPSDCQHDDGSGDGSFTPCEYTKYPEWDGLVEVYAKSGAQSVRTQSPGAIPACPERFQPLSFYDWPTDEEDDPELEYCLELQRNEDLATDKPVPSPTRAPTRAPTKAPNDDSSTAATGAPTIAPDDDNSTTATDAPTIPTSESTTKPISKLSPTTTSFVPTILTGQDITTISPTLPPTLSSTLSPTMPPNLSPTLSSTLSPTISPTMSPTMSPTLSPTLPPNSSPTISPSVTLTMSPSVTPSLTPTAKITDVQMAQCSFHPKCYAQNLAGLCCPTLDGVELGCCGDFWGKDESESSESSARGVFYHRLFAFAALAVLLGCW